MLQHEGVLPSTLPNRPRLVEVTRRLPVMIPEDCLVRWPALSRCLSMGADLSALRSPAPMADILMHCSKLKPCILVIDHAALDQTDPRRLTQAADFGRSVAILVKLVRDDPETVKRLLRLGCMGFLTDRSSPKVILQAIDALSKGEIWASRRVLADFVRQLLSTPSPQTLTPREDQILQLIARGMSNREITQELFISRETVRWHIRTLYAKIGVKNREEAARFASGDLPETSCLPALGTPC